MSNKEINSMIEAVKCYEAEENEKLQFEGIE